MPTYSVWMLDGADIALTGGHSLSGVTQGDGSHLVGASLTLKAPNWRETRLSDDDGSFEDNDSSQRLAGTQSINGRAEANGRVVEAEYRLILRDPQTGRDYEVYGYNVNNSQTAYATVEGLAFRGGPGGFPPIGRPLTVISSGEGPRPGEAGYGQLATPLCFAEGTRILTPTGPRPVEALRPGDRVVTRDHGAQPVLWIGAIQLDPARLAAEPALRPVRIAAGALGPGMPDRDLRLSPSHRVLVGGGRAELLFGVPEVLVAASHLVNGTTIRVDDAATGVGYVHILLPTHGIVWAEGAPAETLCLDPASTRDAQQAELAALFPDLAEAGPKAARRSLRAFEARVLLAGAAPAGATAREGADGGA